MKKPIVIVSCKQCGNETGYLIDDYNTLAECALCQQLCDVNELEISDEVK